MYYEKEVYTYREFNLLRRSAMKQIKRGNNPGYQVVMVMKASRYMSRKCSKREIELALAWAVRVEALVSPENVNPEDLKAAKTCIGSNGHKAMPMWDWQMLG